MVVAQPAVERVGPILAPAESAAPFAGDHDLFRYDIFHFIALSGRQAACWVEEYHATGADVLGQRASHALILLREEKEVQGAQALASVEAALAGDLRGGNPAVRCIVERWYSSVLAYLHYCKGDFDAALDALDRADGAVRQAIGLEPFLLPFAHHCTDFRFQRARIARNRRRWQAMREQLEISREIAAGRQPMCVLADGVAISFVTLRDFYGSLPLTVEARESLRGLLDDEARIAVVERAIIRFCATIGGAIPCP